MGETFAFSESCTEEIKAIMLEHDKQLIDHFVKAYATPLDICVTKCIDEKNREAHCPSCFAERYIEERTPRMMAKTIQRIILAHDRLVLEKFVQAYLDNKSNCDLKCVNSNDGNYSCMACFATNYKEKML